MKRTSAGAAESARPTNDAIAIRTKAAENPQNEKSGGSIFYIAVMAMSGAAGAQEKEKAQ